MKRTLTFVLLSALTCAAQIVVPEGTRLRVRLEQAISSATAEEGQVVEFSVTDSVRSGDNVVIAEGARVTGVITQAQGKRRMGRAGKLDFSIDRVRSADDQWIPVRYTVTKKSGQSHALSTGILTAGVAAVFWPAAPVFLLRKGNDVTINRGVSFDVYTDGDHTMSRTSGVSQLTQPAQPVRRSSAASSEGSAKVSITSPVVGADIEVDGAFVGNTPTTISLASGQHRVLVKQGPKSWQRTVQVRDSSSITLTAALQ
jgi:hypothetical protein